MIVVVIVDSIQIEMRLAREVTHVQPLNLHTMSVLPLLNGVIPVLIRQARLIAIIS